MLEKRGYVFRTPQHSRRYLYLPFLFLAGQVSVLLVLDRDWFCSCGSIRLWQGVLDPHQNSQQLTDHYSLLHLAFGVGLFVWLNAIRPHWSLARLSTYAVASSALWEIFENLPFIIQIFGNDGSSLHYSGDSIVNSLSDTFFVILGFLLAARLPTGLSVATILSLELATYVMIGDGVVAGLLRIARLPTNVS
ncbi:DUF2585 family protein [Pseudorhizobium flavum]|uniref:DUF2585 family protein n=1 Tax=Pseudorhizobium flavum TaxID=1335061 RepID=A0A7W9YZH6_9HYPH|nr:DUF2585 family protein [Pseudorhizobium flavum]MBB6181272.1 hypothetical protein [Pseudorhizobium flavum]CAD6601501.1 hypothetical protein RFYW14_00888 [Pseudorhizobium flavum]